MNKEPLGLYIFRMALGFILFALMCMVYWSSTLVEDDLKVLRSDVNQLKNEFFSMKAEAEKSQEQMRQMIFQDNDNAGGLKQSLGSLPLDKRSQAASQINRGNNFLKTDNFYAAVLPQILGNGFTPSGIQHMATIGKPDNLHPFSNWSQVNSWRSLCVTTASSLQFGKYESFAPNMALSIEERVDAASGNSEFWVHLRDNIYWQPLKAEFFPSNINLAPQFFRKQQVTAEDFKFYYDALMNPYVQEPSAVALRNYYEAIQNVEVIDKLTFVVRWKSENVKEPDGKIVPKIKYIAKQLTGGLKPLPGYVYKYFADGKKIIEEDEAPDTYRTNSVWAQNFVEHWAKNVIVSCGPWIFDGMTERQIKFKRNQSYFAPLDALTEAIEVDFKDSPNNIWQDFKRNHLDSYSLQPDQLMEFNEFLKSDVYVQQAAKGNAIKRLDYVSRSYSYIGWNEAKPFFASAKIRRAMTMAIDRRRIIEQNLNGMGIEITGAFYRYSPAYDPSIIPWAFNPQQARRLLEEEGWIDSDGDGVIDKLIDGKRTPFSFSLTYFVKNPTSKSTCEYVAAALKEIGIECHLKGVDIADLSAVFDDKNFDALCLAWMLGTPPEDQRQLWSSAGAKERGSSNAIGFANAEIDSIIDRLDYEYDEKSRMALYHRFNAIIHEEQPYTFLYTPKVALLYREYLQNVFLPVDRQDLVPGANIAEPDPAIYWIKKNI